MVCTVEGCDRKQYGRQPWCQGHYQRVRKTGDPGPGSISRRKAVITYESAHDRVIRAYGKASLHQCIECNKAAQEWAYHRVAGVPELLSPIGSPYSMELESYKPMCRSCHRKKDGYSPVGKRAHADVAIAAELYNSGWSLEAVGKTLGFAGTTIRAQLKKAGVQIRPGSGGPERTVGGPRRTHCKSGHPLPETGGCIPCRRLYSRDFKRKAAARRREVKRLSIDAVAAVLDAEQAVDQARGDFGL